jgi:hypothetical protein
MLRGGRGLPGSQRGAVRKSGPAQAVKMFVQILLLLHFLASNRVQTVLRF